MNTLHDFKATSLVGRDGELIRRYPPQAKPEDIAADIESVL